MMRYFFWDTTSQIIPEMVQKFQKYHNIFITNIEHIQRLFQDANTYSEVILVLLLSILVVDLKHFLFLQDVYFYM